MGGSPIRSKVMAHVESHTGVHVHLDTMANELKIDRDKVQAAVSNLMRAMPDYPLKTVVAGNVWVYQPNSGKVSKRLYEELATTKSGTILVQDEVGVVYSLTEL